jgi:hypothetical protein
MIKEKKEWHYLNEKTKTGKILSQKTILMKN